MSATGFDFSCLGKEKALIANENIGRLQRVDRCESGECDRLMTRISECEIFWNSHGARNRKLNRVVGDASDPASSVLEWLQRRATRASSRATRDCVLLQSDPECASDGSEDERRSDNDRSQDLIYGVNAVLEALRAGKRQIETITILESARPDRLKSLLELAREKGVPVHRVPRLDLDRSLGDVRHQGVVARIAAARYADADELLDQLESKIGTRGSAVGRWDWTGSKIHVTWDRSCAPPNVRAFMEFSLPSDVPWV